MKDIYKKNRKRRGRSKYLLSVVVEAEKNGRRIPVKVVYVRNHSNRKDYLCLVSTDIEMDEEEIIRIYSKRWGIMLISAYGKSRFSSKYAKAILSLQRNADLFHMMQSQHTQPLYLLAI